MDKKKTGSKPSLCQKDIWHAETHTDHHSQLQKKEKKSLTRVPLAPVCCTRRGGHPSRMIFALTRQPNEREGEAGSTTVVHRKLHRSQQHLPTTLPHAVSHYAHMLLHTKRYSRNSHTDILTQINLHLHTLKIVSVLKNPVPVKHTCECMDRRCTSVWLRCGDCWGWEWRERQRERGAKTSGAYHWLPLSKGGGPGQSRKDEEGGWERGCVRKEKGK